MQAWHFLSEDKRLGYDDGRLVEVGVPLECEGAPELCENGMHGSVRLIDALHYASGPIVCRVEIEGDVIEGGDKLCGRRRTVLWMMDATELLHEFACQCAENALALIDNPDPRSVAAIDAKRKWINGEITDEELAAARSAAWAAARNAAADADDAADDAARAAWAAADAAAWAAADAADAAWAADDAVRAAARNAAADVAWAADDAARAAADDAAAAARDAAWAAAARDDDDARNAAWNAAWAAARAQQNARLTEMVMAVHEKEDD